MYSEIGTYDGTLGRTRCQSTRELERRIGAYVPYFEEVKSFEDRICCKTVVFDAGLEQVIKKVNVDARYSKMGPSIIAFLSSCSSGGIDRLEGHNMRLPNTSIY